MDRDHYLFELPIYRISEDDWLADISARIGRRVNIAMQQYLGSGHEPIDADREHARFFAAQIERPNGWDYNETVGWVKLKHDGLSPLIKGYLWLVGRTDRRDDRPRTQFRRGFTPFPFRYEGKVLECWFSDDQSNSEIFDAQLGL